MLITHDLGVIAEMADYVVVMYAGRIVEKGTAEEIFEHPSHPYTIGLFESIPSLDKDVERLKPVPGQTVDPNDLPGYFSFYDRCTRHTDACKGCDPKLTEVGPGHLVKCIYANGKEEGA